MLQCVHAGEVFCGLHVAYVRIICPVRDVTDVRKCTRPSPALLYCKQREAGRGPGNEATRRVQTHTPTEAQVQLTCTMIQLANVSQTVGDPLATAKALVVMATIHHRVYGKMKGCTRVYGE